MAASVRPETTPFSVGSARGERLPWRLLIRLTGGAEAWLLAKRSISSLLYFAGHQNKLINQSVGAMRKLINGGGLGVRAQMALTSWVDTTQPAGHSRTHAEALPTKRQPGLIPAFCLPNEL